MSYKIKVTKRFEEDRKEKRSIFVEKIRKIEKEPHLAKRLHWASGRTNF